MRGRGFTCNRIFEIITFKKASSYLNFNTIDLSCRTKRDAAMNPINRDLDQSLSLLKFLLPDQSYYTKTWANDIGNQIREKDDCR